MTFPLFLGLAMVLLYLPTPGTWWVWSIAGGLLAATQMLSARGWTETKTRKILVKASLGASLAALVHGLLAAPWPPPARSLALFCVVALGVASTIPRSRRLAAWRASHTARS